MSSLNMYGLNLWKIKKGKTVFNAFIEIVNESNRKPNELWVDQERELYNIIMQEWYSTHYEGNSLIAEKFIKTLQGEIYKKIDS